MELASLVMQTNDELNAPHSDEMNVELHDLELSLVGGGMGDLQQ